MIIGFTGSRTGMSVNAYKKLQEFLNANEIIEGHHGDCIGADTTFHRELEQRNVKIVIHPPDNDQLRAFNNSQYMMPVKPYLMRNKDIVKACDVLIAFPSQYVELLKSGTWSTIRYARKINKKVYIFYPDGFIET